MVQKHAMQNDILCFSTTDWHAQHGSRQEIMKRLSAKGQRVLFVEPPRNIGNYRAFAFRKGTLADAFTDRFRKEMENLWVYTPGIIFPGGIATITNFLGYRLILLPKIRKLLALLGMRNVILWIYPVPCESLIGKCGEVMRVYHCIDEFTEMTSPIASGKLIWKREGRLVQRADVVFASSRSILQRRRQLNPNTYYLPSAVDTQLFSPMQAAPLQDLAVDEDKKVVGMVGMIDDRIDVELIRKVASSFPQALFVFIGPVVPGGDPFKRALLGSDNVLFLGSKPKQDLPKYIARFDVCIIPYRIDKFTQAISPLKFYEYLAMGKPIVATGLAEVEENADLAYLAQNAEEFSMKIRIAFSEPEGIAQTRRAFAIENSWEMRIEFIEKVLSEHV